MQDVQFLTPAHSATTNTDQKSLQFQTPDTIRRVRSDSAVGNNKLGDVYNLKPLKSTATAGTSTTAPPDGVAYVETRATTPLNGYDDAKLPHDSERLPSFFHGTEEVALPLPLTPETPGGESGRQSTTSCNRSDDTT